VPHVFTVHVVAGIAALTRIVQVLHGMNLSPVAVGHQPGAGGGLEPVPRWSSPRGDGPCGGTLATTAGDLLAFAAAVVRPGPLLAAESVAAMRTPQVSLPPGWPVPSWLGDRLARRPAGALARRRDDGQHSVLWALPERELSVCVLTNGGDTGSLRETLPAEVLADLAGYEPPAPASRPRSATPAALDPSGTYETHELRVTVARPPAGPTVAVETWGATAAELPSFTLPLAHVDADRYELALGPRPVPVGFLGEDGVATHLYVAYRAVPRVR
jgi:hypothetical protein